MKFFTPIYMFLLVSTLALTSQIQASFDDFSDCWSSCYECRCEPLYACSWGVQVQAGVRPILWHDRGCFSTVTPLIPTSTVTTTVNNVGEISKFSRLYRVPYQVGGQLSFAWNCNTNIFVEFNYASAHAKNHCNLLGTSGLLLNVSKYRLYDGYFGGRYYCNRWCNLVSFFVGAKIGFVHHKSIDACFAPAPSIFSYPDYVPTTYNFFRRNTVFSGGVHAGFDICLSGNWSFVITGEVIANHGPRRSNITSLSLDDSVILNGASSLCIPGVGTELAFPVTFGFKYNF